MRQTVRVVVLVGLLVSQALSASLVAEERDAGFLFALAQLYRFQGAYDEALATFRMAAEAEPEDPFIHIEFGEFLFQLGQLDEAAEQVAFARRKTPSNREALRLSGRIQLRLGERSVESLDRAADIFEQLRALDPLDIDVRVTLGRLHLNRSRPGAAAEALREAHDMRPEDRLITSLLVEALSNLAPDAEVLEELGQLVDRDPAFLQPRLALAIALSTRGDQRGVVELLEGAPGDVRGNVDLLRLLAFAYYRTGSLESALETSDLWLERRPDDTMGRYLRSLTLAALGRDSEAEESLQRLVEETPQSEEFALALAELLERQGRSSEAAGILRGLMAEMARRGEHEKRRRTLLVLADVLTRAEDWNEVLVVVDQALGDGGGDPRLQLLKSRALEELGRREEALDVLDSLESVDGQEGRMIASRARLLFLLDREPEAEELIERLSNSDDLDGLMLAAEVFHEVELFSRAVPVLIRAAEQAPEDLEVIFWLGASYERAGQFSDAEREFRRLLDFDENFAPALNYLGYMWADQGTNLEEALVLVQRAVALEPNNGAYLDSLGWAYYQSGRYEEAREPLEKAVKIVRTDPIVFEHLGDLYRAIGRAAEARSAYEKALDLGAENGEKLRRKLDEISDP